MRRIVGFAVFFVAIGMIIGLVLPNTFSEIIIILAFLLLGYHLFCY